ncbi:unnamed protein product [Rhizoctonia solani]|uniref:Transmembrane protein n=1 Tax=Rhizoctonia solani TaxID=456999 RepID=A0A8H3HSK6_9AGAM|nr:unnamed protein product [Rhizoctonia solani]
MAARQDAVEPIEPHDTLEQEPKSHSAPSSSPLLPQDLSPSTTNDAKLTAKVLMLMPLMAHLAGSVVIATALIYVLDGRYFYLDRQPRVKLADGTHLSGQLGQNNILQSDITTILSVALVLLRWVAAVWAVPLCWRVIFLLAGRNGLRHRDIRWVINYGVLPPATYLRHSHNMALGLVLIFTLAPYPASPLVTGSVSWVPSSSTIELVSRPAINISGPVDSELVAGGRTQGPTFSTDAVINLNTAWSQDIERGVFKRVVPLAAQLNINSTIDSVPLAFFAATKIEWFSKAVAEERVYQAINSSANSSNFRPFIEQMGQPGAIGLIITNYSALMWPPDFPTLPLLINVARKRSYNPSRDVCNSNTTFLPNDTTVPSFRLERVFARPATSTLFLDGCYVYANVSYHAGFGTCRHCRVTSPSTVQNDTELQDMKTSGSTDYAVELMYTYLPTLTHVKGALPELADSLETYVTAALIRSHSALWTNWNDEFGYTQNSTYMPAFSTLKAEISHPRVYGWFILQLSLTLAGLAFIWLQWGSEYSLIEDTSMVAFNIDSTEVPKPSRLSKGEPRDMLRIEGKEDGWKVVVASGRFSRGIGS